MFSTGESARLVICYSPEQTEQHVSSQRQMIVVNTTSTPTIQLGTSKHEVVT
jgi:hypothetical protein